MIIKYTYDIADVNGNEESQKIVYHLLATAIVVVTKDNKIVFLDLQNVYILTEVFDNLGSIYAYVDRDKIYPTKINLQGMNMASYFLGSTFNYEIIMVNLVENDSILHNTI